MCISCKQIVLILKYIHWKQVPLRRCSRRGLGTSNQYNACLPFGILVDFKTRRTLNQAQLLNQGRPGPDSKTVLNPKVSCS